jgi:long-chain fatty acid transport protein
MPGKKLWVAGSVILFLGAAGNALGSGYSIYEQGAKAMANAGAFRARADDPSALFFNPAGILQLKGMQIQIGTTAVFLTGSEFGSSLTGDEFEQEDNVAWPSSLYFTQKLGDDWAWGMAFTSPFGLKTQWGPDFEGRYISREANLAVVNLNANAARRLGKSWSVALGINYATTDIRELSRNISWEGTLLEGSPDGFTKLTGDGNDIGWNVAARWASESGWSWGGSYRSEMKPEISGDVKFEDIPAPAAALFPNGPASAVLPLPATFATGVGYVSKGKWEGEFDIVWTGWSSFDRLRVDIKNNTPYLEDVDQVEDWSDTLSFRAGYIYRLTEEHQVRLGFYYDQNPMDDEHVRPRLPDADRSSAQVGYGYAGKNGLTIDFAYQALFFKDRTAVGDPTSAEDPVLPGVYRNFTSLVGISFGYRFGK